MCAIDAMDFEALASFAKENDIDLTFVGPEQPLAEGIVDYFNERGYVFLDQRKRQHKLKEVNHLLKKL